MQDALDRVAVHRTVLVRLSESCAHVAALRLNPRESMHMARLTFWAKSPAHAGKSAAELTGSNYSRVL